jgi:intein/homing endonuclease
MFFNGEEDKKFSLEHPMFVKSNGVYEVIESGHVKEGDFLLQISESGSIIEILVESVTAIAEDSIVYNFGCEPEDWFIAGGYLVHNK